MGSRLVSDLLAKSQFYWSSLERVGNERGGEGETKRLRAVMWGRLREHVETGQYGSCWVRCSIHVVTHMISVAWMVVLY